ncbi:hypothetical protein FRB93_000139 [Tulasnella sp. JGI-2019a]|nr:hypothetical protein FRB93_000139 [Tulasnella sp. JGI-2019a]
MRSISLFLVASSLAAPAISAPRGSLVAGVSNAVSWFTGYGGDLPSTAARGDDQYPDTIYRVLKGKPEFSTLMELLDKVPNVRDTLDSDKKLTFFAPTNDALEHNSNAFWVTGDDDDHKHHMEKVLEDTFKYHIIPGVIESRLFGQNSTIATHLQARDGSFDHARRRIKVQSSALPPWTTTLNNYVHITQADIHAKNGIIHVISAPLYLPPDIMDIVYMLPDHLAITATALLKTNLQSNYEFNSEYKRRSGDHRKHLNHHNDRHGRGSPVTTLFVPTNEAWEKLPKDLRLYLFSPFGERTLRKLMAWHTLPDTVVFTEWGRQVHHHHSSSSPSFDDEDLSFEWDKHFTSFIDQKMPVHVKKSETKLPGSHNYNVQLQAHGIYADMIDNPAQNGVFHTVPQVLSPRNVEGVDEEQNQKDWNEWREWLTE